MYVYVSCVVVILNFEAVAFVTFDELAANFLANLVCVSPSNAR